MPRVRSDGVVPQWPQLQAKAATQGGYFSLREAADHGIGRQLLQHHVGAGSVRRIGRGAFQLAHFPVALHEEGVLAWLWSEGVGLLSHETALRLHGLIDVWPAQVHLTLPQTWRRLRVRAPAGVVLHYWNVDESFRVGCAPLPFTDLDQSLLEAAAQSTEPELVESAFVRVLERELREESSLRMLLHPHHPLRGLLKPPPWALAQQE
jgi:hypothetical protein